MKASKKIFLVLLSTFMITFSSFAQQAFEGIIEFKKIGTTDTTYYIYTIKGNRVKIDEINSITKQSDGTFLVDLETKMQLSVNHERKLYSEKNPSATPPLKGICEVSKTGNTKMLQGYKCSEVVVINKEEETKITYYLAEDKFIFFNKLLNILNRRDKSSVYFLKIMEPSETFPMLSIHTDLKGKPTARLEVIKVTKKIVDPAQFEIPKGYTKFEK